MKTVVPEVSRAAARPQIGLEQYYSEAGPDYAAWSREFNMHFGYYRGVRIRWTANPCWSR